MCAIFGLGFMKGHKVENSEMVRNILRNLFKENQIRGRTAAGLACVTSREIHVVKKDVCGSTLVTLPEYEHMERKYVTFSTAPDQDPKEIAKEPPISYIGHCRLKTKGSELNNVNNHPIVRKEVVGVHNGMIGNDDHLFDIYKKTFPRNGEVDSEIIFALIEHFSRIDASRHIHKAIQKASQTLLGGMACAFAHVRQPHVVWLFRRGGPCDVVIFRDVGMVAWSSLQQYTTRAVRDYTGILGKAEVIELAPNEGIGIDLFRNLVHRFDLYEYSKRNNALSMM